MPIAPEICIKGMLVIFIFGVGTLDWSSEPVQCALCE